MVGPPESSLLQDVVSGEAKKQEIKLSKGHGKIATPSHGGQMALLILIHQTLNKNEEFWIYQSGDVHSAILEPESHNGIVPHIPQVADLLRCVEICTTGLEETQMKSELGVKTHPNECWDLYG